MRCTGSPGEPASCLTQREADAIDRVWDGSRNRFGQRLWGGPTRGTAWTTLAGGAGGALNQPASIPFGHVRAVVEQDPNWDYRNLRIDNFDIQFQKQDIKEARVGADNVNLDSLKSRGGKLLTWHGGNDTLILPFRSGNTGGAFSITTAVRPRPMTSSARSPSRASAIAAEAPRHSRPISSTCW